MQKIYSKGAVLAELKKRNLPASYKHFLKLEKQNIVSLPSEFVLVGIVGRVYSEAEVNKILDQVAADQERKKKK